MQQKATNNTRMGYSKKEASKETSLSIRMLDHYISIGVLKAHNYGSRVIISGKSLQRFIEHGPIPYPKSFFKKTKELIKHDQSV